MPLWYERTYYVSSFATRAQVVGVMSVGLLAGYDIALSYATLPSLLMSRLPTDRLLVAWDNIYTRSENLGRPLIIASLLAFIKAAAQANALPGVASTPFGVKRRTQLVFASLSILAVLPLKFFSFDPLVWRLEAARNDVEEASNTGQTATLDDDGVREDMVAFNKRRAWRAGLFGTAFFLGITAC